MGKILIVVGLVCIIAGLVVLYGPKNLLPGRLPGDIRVERENFSFYFPVMTSIILSVLVSLLLYFVNRWKI
jgi:hypothetical protein